MPDARAAKSEGRRVRILAIDGGGIRGIIPARVLAAIEREAGRPVSELFDLIAGTSTGGILACAIAAPALDGSPKYRAEELADLYTREGPRIFDRSLLRKARTLGGLAGPRYPIEPLSEVLEERLGDLRLTDALVPLLLTAYDLEGRRPFFFKTSRAREEPGRDVPLRLAALATSAAPTYFEPVLVETDTERGSGALVDGGVYANNPAMCAFSEVKAADPDADVVVISLGTGEQTRPIRFEQARGWGLARWATSILDVVFDGISDTTDFHLEQLLGPDRYRRVQVELAAGMGSDRMDDAESENLRRLRDTGDRLAERALPALRPLLGLL